MTNTIPNQTNIINIIKSQLEEYTKLINIVNTTVIKCGEANINPKTVDNVRTITSSVSDIIMIFAKGLVNITGKINSITTANTLVGRVISKNPFGQFYQVINVVDEVAEFTRNLKNFNKITSLLTIKRAIKNVKKTIDLISKSTFEIAFSLAELKISDAASKTIGFVLNPGIYIKKLWQRITKSKDIEGDKQENTEENKDERLGILQTFLLLANIVASISKAGELFSFIGLLKARIGIKLAFNGIVKVYKYMLIQAIKFKLTSNKITEQVREQFKSGIGNILDVMNTYTEQILTVLKEYTILGKDFVKKAINTIFSTISIGVKFLSYSVGDLYIVASEVQKFNQFKKRDMTKSMNVVNSIIAGVYDMVNSLSEKQSSSKKWTGFKDFFETELLVLLEPAKWIIFFSSIKLIMEGLSEIGKNTKNIELGMSVVDKMFKLSKNRKAGLALYQDGNNEADINCSIVDIFTRIIKYSKKYNKDANNALIFIAKFVGTLGMIFSIISVLKYIGEYKRYVKRGLETVYFALYGQQKGFFKFRKYGLIDIFTDQRITKRGLISKIVLNNIISLGKICAIMIPIMISLIFVGRNWIRIQLGVFIFGNVLRKLVDTVINVVSDKNQKAFTNNLKLLWKNGVKLFVVFSGAIVLIALLSSIAVVAPLSIITLSIIWVIFKFFGKILTNIEKIPDVPKGVFRLNFIMSSLVIAATAIAAISALSINFNNIVTFIICYLGLMSAVIITLCVLNGVGNFMTAGIPMAGKFMGVAMVASFALVLLIIGNALYQFAKMMALISAETFSYKAIWQLAVCIFTICLVVVALSLVVLAAPFALVSIALVTLVVTMMLVLALELQLLSKFDPNVFDMARINAKRILGAGYEIINTITEENIKRNEKKSENGRNGFRRFLGKIPVLGGLLDVWDDLMSFGNILLMFMSIGVVYLIAGVLKGLEQQKLTKVGDDFAAAVAAKDIINAGFSIMKAIEGERANQNKLKGNDGSKNGLRRFLGQIPVLGGILDVFDMLVGFGSVFMILLTTGVVFFIAKVLQGIEKISLTPGNSNGITKAEEVAINVVGVGFSIKRAIERKQFEDRKKGLEGGDENWIRSLLGKIPVLGGLLDVIDGIINFGQIAFIFATVGMIHLIAKNLETIQNLNIDKTTITDKITGPNGIIEIANVLVNQVSESNINTLKEDKVNLYSEFVDDSVKYFNSINKLNIDKVKSISDMYVKMGEFMSKLEDAPINDIADALVNKISPALSSINESMNKNKGNATVSLQTSQPVTQNTKPVVDTNNTSTNITNNQQPQNNAKITDYTELLENIETLLEQIKTKLSVKYDNYAGLYTM